MSYQTGQCPNCSETKPVPFKGRWQCRSCFALFGGVDGNHEVVR